MPVGGAATGAGRVRRGLGGCRGGLSAYPRVGCGPPVGGRRRTRRGVGGRPDQVVQQAGGVRGDHPQPVLRQTAFPAAWADGVKLAPGRFQVRFPQIGAGARG
ncbi:hypothetical protein, partial [Micromonospora wenchangensis]|uniref:hypothetical protein n=1 Tax=Micromonospora wenchangensis TaxID=1185415 RepID=UPI0034212ECD